MTTPTVRRGRLVGTVAATAAALLGLLAVSACSSSGSGKSDSGSSGSGSAGGGSGGSSTGGSTGSGGNGSASQVKGTVVVFAAASLKESFTTLGKEFSAAYPNAKVVFDFGGSDSLASGITGGAPADVFASASPATMKTVTDAGDAAGTPVTFVRNQLEIATAPGNPRHIASLKDLAGPGLKVALCAKKVPCGAAAQKALTAGHVALTPVSYEQDVKSALTKVELKEVDASVVYRTDVAAAHGKVTGVDFPESAQAVNSYPIAALKDAPNPNGAQAFIAFVRSAEGQKVLGRAGFMKP